jgi:hypothetical protein
MKMKSALIVAGSMLLAGNLLASLKTQEFKGTMDQVWSACIRAAADKFSLTFSDKASGVLTFATGTSLRSNGMNASVSLKATDEGKIEVSVTPQKTKQMFAWGAGGSIAQKYFKAIEENLSDQHHVALGTGDVSFGTLDNGVPAALETPNPAGVTAQVGNKAGKVKPFPKSEYFDKRFREFV